MTKTLLCVGGPADGQSIDPETHRLAGSFRDRVLHVTSGPTGWEHTTYSEGVQNGTTVLVWDGERMAA